MSAERRRRHIPSDSAQPVRLAKGAERSGGRPPSRMLLIHHLLVVVPKSTGEVDPVTRTMGVVDATVLRHHKESSS